MDEISQMAKEFELLLRKQLEQSEISIDKTEEEIVKEERIRERLANPDTLEKYMKDLESVHLVLKQYLNEVRNRYS